jgi:hypothetical protein
MMPVSINSQGAWQDRRVYLLLIEKVLEQLEGLVIDSQQVGIDLPAGQDDGVVIGSLHLVDGLVDLHQTT